MEFLDPKQVLEVVKNLGALVSLVYASWSLWDKLKALSQKRSKTCKKIQ